MIDHNAAKRARIEAARLKGIAKPEDAAIQVTREFVKPAEAKNRLRIVFDNSRSMSTAIHLIGGMTCSTRMNEAKKGVIEFLRNCTPNKDAVAIHMLNKPYQWQDFNKVGEGNPAVSTLIINSELCSDLIRLASAVDNPELTPTGGTPLFECLESTLDSEPKATRIVAFSDGEANSTTKMGVVISIAKKNSIPIDTVFFGPANSNGASTLKELAEATGGIFLAFDPVRGVSFASAFKYLTEGNRKMLMNAEFKAKLEKGEVK